MSRAPDPLSPLDDAELVRLANLGDREAFRMLYKRYERPLWAYLVRRVGPSDADDVLQETWSKVFEKLAMFDGRHFRGWTYQIARRSAVDHLRLRNRTPVQ